MRFLRRCGTVFRPAAVSVCRPTTILPLPKRSKSAKNIIMKGIDAALRKRSYSRGVQEAVSPLFWKDANKHATRSL